MVLRYSKVWAYVLLVGGGINVFLGLWLLLLGSFAVSIVIGPLLMLIGYLYLTKPYVRVNPNQLVIYAPLGTVAKTVDYSTTSDLKIENNTIFVRENSAWKKVPVAKFLVQGEDWVALTRTLGTAA